MNETRFGYRVSLRPVERTGLAGGGMTLWTPTKERAEEIVSAEPAHRSYEAVPWNELPDGIRARFEGLASSPPAAA